MSAIPLAQTDPTEALAKNLGAELVLTKSVLAHLTSRLARLDQLQKDLLEHGLDIDIDLGPVGNAARAARLTVEEHRAGHPKAFELPR